MEAACLFAQRLQVEQILPSAMKRIFTAACVIVIKKARSMPITTLSGNRLAAYVMLNAITGLPAQIARKEIAEIASKKRAEYRRRYEMLDAIQPQMATMFRG
ncbi:virulence protein [Escherichia coli]|uniref:Virulence protein n=1 Tax=Escherichia coli TaxID=562 RepID=A0A376ZT59_ECOLX|nr:virulence protein [Escherichia coli]